MVYLIYPTDAELSSIAQTLVPRLEANRPIFRKFPIVNKDAHIIMWEQQDNYVGLQQIRGLGGMPPVVKPVGGKRYTMEPGIYGEFMAIDEVEMTLRRAYGTFADRIDITDLVMERQRQLLGRRYDRIEQILWTLVTTGTFSITGPTGAILYTDSYTFQTYNASSWGTPGTATPLADFRAVQLKARGYSVDFGAPAEAWMNRVTANKLLVNTNTADLYGRRTDGLATANSIGAVNTLLTGEGLPNIVVYDNGYLDDSGTFVPYIADDVVIVFGRRTDGAQIGQYTMTRNANNDGFAAGAYMKVVDNKDREVPRLVQVHDGHNGGVELHFPSAICVMDVS